MKDIVKLEDLLLNQDFIAWIKHPNKELDVYWKQWIQDNPQSQQTVMYAKAILRSAQFYNEDPSEQDYIDTLSNIINHHGTSGKRNVSFDWKPVLNMAASFIMLISMAIMIYSFNRSLPFENPVSESIRAISKENPSGQKTQFQLPDGTTVWLNAQSTLTFPQKFSENERLVQLQGEAYFEVVENKASPFIVKTGMLSTKALGTSFNINYYQDQLVTVSLVTGKVLISHDGDELILNPGEQMSYNQQNRTLLKQPFNYRATTGWKDGIIHFENADFPEVITLLERWYGVDIIVQGEPAANWAYQGTFNNQSLEIVLQRLSFSKEFEYEIEGKNVKIDF